MSAVFHLNAPEINFAHDCRRHVLTTLSALMPVSACMIALGRAEFAEEYDTIVSCAWNLGGWFLRDDLWLDLEDWISDQLLVAIDAFEAEFEEYERRRQRYQHRYHS